MLRGVVAGLALAVDAPTFAQQPRVIVEGLVVLAVAEALVAATVNGAAALGLADKVGQLAEGFSADIALFEIGDYRELPYWLGARVCRVVALSNS